MQQGAVNGIQLRQDFVTALDENGEIADTTIGTSDGKNFVTYLANISKNTTALKVYLSPFHVQCLDSDAPNSLGWAPLHGDYAFVEFAISKLTGGYVLAHEIGHALGATHPDDTGTGNYPHRIMNKTLSTPLGDHKDARRFGNNDQDQFVGDKFYK